MMVFFPLDRYYKCLGRRLHRSWSWGLRSRSKNAVCRLCEHPRRQLRSHDWATCFSSGAEWPLLWWFIPHRHLWVFFISSYKSFRKELEKYVIIVSFEYFRTNVWVIFTYIVEMVHLAHTGYNYLTKFVLSLHNVCWLIHKHRSYIYV